MKIKNSKTEDKTFGKGLVKTLITSFAVTAGAWAGFLASTMAVGSVVKLQEDRYDKKHRIETP